MTKGIHAGELAVDYLARHPGFHNRKQIGELFVLLRTKNGRRLPPGLALQQRLNDRIRSGAEIQTYYERKNGCIVRAYYWCSRVSAALILQKQTAKAARKVRT